MTEGPAIPPVSAVGLRQACDDAARALDRLNAALGGTVQSAVEAPFEPSFHSAVEDPDARHRRQHRTGRLSKIDANPDLRAFVLARIDRLTFADIAAEAAAHFPPETRPSRSGLHRWWHRHRAETARR